MKLFILFTVLSLFNVVSCQTDTELFLQERTTSLAQFIMSMIDYERTASDQCPLHLDYDNVVKWVQLNHESYQHLMVEKVKAINNFFETLNGYDRVSQCEFPFDSTAFDCNKLHTHDYSSLLYYGHYYPEYLRFTYEDRPHDVVKFMFVNLTTNDVNAMTDSYKYHVETNKNHVDLC